MSPVDQSRNRGTRTFPRGWVPFVLSMFGLVVIYMFTSHNIQIAPVPQEGGAGWVLSMICAGLAGCLIGSIVARNDKAMLVRSVLGFGIAAAISAGMLHGAAIEIIRGVVDFPPSSTREYRTLLPISYGRRQEASGKRPELTWVLLSGYNAKVAINTGDYRFMERALDEQSDSINIANRFCVNVVVQKSRGNVRIMDTMLGHLPPHSVIACNLSGSADLGGQRPTPEPMRCHDSRRSTEASCAARPNQMGSLALTPPTIVI